MYVVSGITGHTGRIVAEQLRAAGKKVRALVRNPSHVAELEERGYEVRVVDLGDTEALTAALRGAHGAYLLVPPYYGPGILDHHAKIGASIGAALADAALPRAVLLSSVGAEHPAGTGPIVTCYRLEQACADLPAVTFLRAAFFLENWIAMAEPAKTAGILPNFLSSDRSMAMVATADIGRTAAALLLQESPPPRIVELAGPEDLTPLQIAETMSQLKGKPVELKTLPLTQAVPTFTQNGVSTELAELFAELYQASNDGRLTFEKPRRGTATAIATLRPAFGS